VRVSSIACDFQWAKRMSHSRSSSSANGSGLRPARWQAPAVDPVTTERSVWDAFALTRHGVDYSLPRMKRGMTIARLPAGRGRLLAAYFTPPAFVTGPV
jgi:hypothetical protein